MKVKELIEKLNEFNSEMDVIWHDAIEGNSLDVVSVVRDIHIQDEVPKLVVYISPMLPGNLWVRK